MNDDWREQALITSIMMANSLLIGGFDYLGVNGCYCSSVGV